MFLHNGRSSGVASALTVLSCPQMMGSKLPSDDGF